MALELVALEHTVGELWEVVRFRWFPAHRVKYHAKEESLPLPLSD